YPHKRRTSIPDLESGGGLLPLGSAPLLDHTTQNEIQRGNVTDNHESIDSAKGTISPIRVRYSAHLGRRPSLCSRVFDPHRDTAGVLPSRPTGRDFPKNADFCRTGSLSASN